MSENDQQKQIEELKSAIEKSQRALKQTEELNKELTIVVKLLRNEIESLHELIHRIATEN